MKTKLTKNWQRYIAVPAMILFLAVAALTIYLTYQRSVKQDVLANLRNVIRGQMSATEPTYESLWIDELTDLPDGTTRLVTARTFQEVAEVVLGETAEQELFVNVANRFDAWWGHNWAKGIREELAESDEGLEQFLRRMTVLELDLQRFLWKHERAELEQAQADAANEPAPTLTSPPMDAPSPIGDVPNRVGDTPSPMDNAPTTAPPRETPAMNPPGNMLTANPSVDTSRSSNDAPTMPPLDN